MFRTFPKKNRKKKMPALASALLVLVIFSSITFVPLVSKAELRVDNAYGPAVDGGNIDNPDQSGCSVVGWGYFSLACLISRVNSLIGRMAGFLIMIVMMILEYALYINSKVLQLPAVQLGWNFTRDVANMGFVVGIIVIAFATILRNQSYGVKQLIVRLIVAAVMVNLSLAIVGIFLDVAGIPTQFFIDKISGFSNASAGGMSTTLASAFNIQNIEEINAAAGNSTGYLAEGIGILFSVIFSLVFSFIILVTLIALTYMFIHRFIVIAILTILLPLAILAWVFPIYRGRWNQWLSMFLTWTFFGPAALFFLYLAVYTVRVQGNYLTVAAQSLKAVPLGPAVAVDQISKIGTNNPTLLIANMITMVALTIGGLFAAQKLGIAGASAAIGTVTNRPKRWLKSSQDYVGNIPGRIGGSAADAVRNRMLTAGANQIEDGKAQPSYLQRRVANLASIPGLGRMFSGPAERIGKATKEFQGKVSPEVGKFDSQTKDYRLATLGRMTSFADATRASALMLSMAKKGELRNLDANQQERLKELLPKLNQTGSAGEFARYMPEYAEKIGQKIREVMPKAPADAYAEMKADVFSSEKNGTAAEAAVLYGSSLGLRTLAERGDWSAVSEIMKTFEKLTEKFKDFNEEAQKTIIEQKSGSTDENDVEAVKAAKEKISDYRRFIAQRGVLYENPVFAGAANKENLEEWREEKRQQTTGKKSTNKRAPNSFSNNPNQTQSQ